MKWCKLTVILIVVLLFSSCSQPTENGVTPAPVATQYTTEDLFTITGSKEIITLSENVENPGKLDENRKQENIDLPEYLKPQENIEYVKYDSANRYRSADVQEDVNSLFCMDPDTGIAYFVNQNKDWYIYRIVDGKAEPAVELPARELYVRDGKIYFILDAYDKYILEGLTEGAVYSYSLYDNTMDMVVSAEGLEDEIFRIRPYEDGLAFCCMTMEKVSDTRWQIDFGYYFYDFSDGTLETDLYMRVWPGWEEYYLAWNKEEEYVVTSLWSRTKQDEERIDFDFIGYKSFIVEETMYWFNGAQACVTNLSNKEQKIYDINGMVKNLAPELAAKWEEDNVEVGIFIDGCTMTKDYIWMLAMGPLIVGLDLASGESVCYCLEGFNCEAYELYTDGINLYASYEQNIQLGQYKKEGALVRICTEKITGHSKDYDVPLVAVEYLTD